MGTTAVSDLSMLHQAIQNTNQTYKNSLSPSFSYLKTSKKLLSFYTSQVSFPKQQKNRDYIISLKLKLWLQNLEEWLVSKLFPQDYSSKRSQHLPTLS